MGLLGYSGAETPYRSQSNLYIAPAGDIAPAPSSRSQVIANATQAGVGTSTLYIVPANAVLFVTMANISTHSSAAGTTGTTTLTAGGREFLGITTDATDSIAHSIAFLTPMKALSGETVQLVVATDAQITARAAFVGYQEPAGIK